MSLVSKCALVVPHATSAVGMDLYCMEYLISLLLGS